MNYQKLQAGEVLQKDDEYSAHNQEWKAIPDFLIGDKVSDCPHTLWRRPIVSNSVKQKPKKKSLWKSILLLFKKF